VKGWEGLGVERRQTESWRVVKKQSGSWMMRGCDLGGQGAGEFYGQAVG